MVNGQWNPAKSIGARPRPLGLFGRFLVQDVDVHLYLHDVLYRIHIRVVGHAEILPIDREGAAKPPSVVFVEDMRDFDLDLFGHSAQRQIAHDGVFPIAGLRDLLQLLRPGMSSSLPKKSVGCRTFGGLVMPSTVTSPRMRS